MVAVSHNIVSNSKVVLRKTGSEPMFRSWTFFRTKSDILRAETSTRSRFLLEPPVNSLEFDTILRAPQHRTPLSLISQPALHLFVN